jgi:hypothetical protein
MATRPTIEWREGIKEEARLVASGVLEPGFAVAAHLFPPALLLRTDQILDTFEREVSELHHPTDEAILAVIRRLVLGLNLVHHEFDEDAFATGERDMLCAYIDEVVTESGADLDALATRQGVPRDEITDDWRHW